MAMRDGRPAQPGLGPVSLGAPRGGSAPAGGGRTKSSRGNEEHPIGYPSKKAGAPGATPEAFVAALIHERDLAHAADALSRSAVKAWVTVATAQGPQAMELAEYLRRLGSA